MHLSKDLKLLEDGLNTVSYKVIQTEKKPLYTRILVKLPAFSDLPRKELYITTDGKIYHNETFLKIIIFTGNFRLEYF